jgi:hypothetical protein
MDPVPPSLSPHDHGKWLRGHRATHFSRLLPPENIQNHLQVCLEARHFDAMLEQNRHWIFLVTETHGISSWATTLRHQDEAIMRLGVYFSEGQCVGFGWETRDQMCSNLPHAFPSGDLPAAFVSGYYIFARSGFSPEDLQSLAGPSSLSRHNSSFTTGSFSGSDSHHAGGPSIGRSAHGTAAGPGTNVSVIQNLLGAASSRISSQNYSPASAVARTIFAVCFLAHYLIVYLTRTDAAR